jgi:uncharacterized protein (DUF433 family)
MHTPCLSILIRHFQFRLSALNCCPEVAEAVVYSPSNIIVKDPDILGGTAVFRGTRVPFQALLDYLEGGETLDEFLDDFPTVTRQAAVSALELAKNARPGQIVKIER